MYPCALQIKTTPTETRVPLQAWKHQICTRYMNFITSWFKTWPTSRWTLQFYHLYCLSLIVLLLIAHCVLFIYHMLCRDTRSRCEAKLKVRSNQFISMKPDWRVNPELREKPDTVNVKPYKNTCLLTLVLKALLFILSNAIFSSIHSHHKTTHVRTSMHSLNMTKYMWHWCPLALCMKSQVKMAELF